MERYVHKKASQQHQSYYSKGRENPKVCHLIDEQMNKNFMYTCVHACIYTTEGYLPTQSHPVLTHTSTWMNLEQTVLSERSQIQETTTSRVAPCMRNVPNCQICRQKTSRGQEMGNDYEWAPDFFRVMKMSQK